MSIQEFGALGEGIGSLLILITLIYLAIQNRYQQKLLLSQAYQARTDTFVSTMEWFVTNSSVAGRATKLINGEELTQTEYQQAQYYAMVLLRSLENNHFQNSLGVLPEEFSVRSSVTMLFQHQGSAQFWPEIRSIYRESFAELVDEIIQEIEQGEAAA